MPFAFRAPLLTLAAMAVAGASGDSSCEAAQCAAQLRQGAVAFAEADEAASLLQTDVAKARVAKAASASGGEARAAELASAAAFAERILETSREDGLEAARANATKWGQPCATVVYQAKYALPANAEGAGMSPPMAVGTPENMDSRLVELGLDFTGVWWMKGNPVAEELVSFAGTKVNSSTYPVVLEVPNQAKGMWSWNDSIMGWGLNKFYSLYDASEPTDFEFFNTTYGEIETSLNNVPLVWVDSFPFEYINKDEWNRPTYFQDKSLFPNTNYTLTRVIMGDGSPHPVFWDEFMEHMSAKSWWGPARPGEKQMLSFNSDSNCMRKCQIALPCFSCKVACR